MRHAIVEKITDQNALAKLAFKTLDNNVRDKTVSKITDQSILAEIALKCKHWNGRYAAVRKLTDQNVLKEIALKDEDSNVRSAAVNNLDDQIILAEFAKNDNDENVRGAAVEKLTDQNTLYTVMKNDSDSYVRCKAASRIAGQLLIEDTNLELLLEVIRTLGDRLKKSHSIDAADALMSLYRRFHKSEIREYNGVRVNDGGRYGTYHHDSGHSVHSDNWGGVDGYCHTDSPHSDTHTDEHYFEIKEDE